jgi:hypothetical protein
MNIVQYNNSYYIKNFGGSSSYLVSCGYSSTGSYYGNLSIATYKIANSYITQSPSWSRWKLVNRDDPYKRHISYNDIVTIRLEANNYYLVTCSTNSCNSYSYLSVSASKYKGPSNVFSGNAQYWKIISPEGITGKVQFGDTVKILNLWGSNSYLNTCGNTSECGSNKLYSVNTTRQNTLDSRSGVSNWSINKSLD